MALINQFMVENEEDIMEFIKHPEGELAQKWIEQGEAVKEYIGCKEPSKDEVVFRPPTIGDEIARVIHKDDYDKIMKRKHLRSIRKDKKTKRLDEEAERNTNETAKPLSLEVLLRGNIL
ncbi:hypothetical protein JDFnp1_152 [Fusobacterium phage JD-Fnp1]|nr:hypothetical protein JDFnp1_152 [Fusobacterium phage JD-Fnp1]